ncbi:tubulin-folding cofactor B [Gouania willdenowi]|uniref:CAP-Gly domain-containing protein n=1 Tax=Gouania willdenowi TaxID=441366 RepID=A0A8C5GFA5_GOUWI|nr:tubulin-folding cofactor B [Gouania willdenowi]XP_028320440.1 tubulin-folding cofactor B [Gouania willdenowi]
MDSGVEIITNPLVDVRLTSTRSSFESQRRFKRGIRIADLKLSLEMIVGAPSSFMELELFSVTDAFLLKLDNDEALLGSYPVDDNCRIHVIDKSGAQMDEFSDLSKGEKYDLSDDVYEQRTDSARTFKKKHNFGRFKEEEDIAKKKAEKAAREEEEKVAAAAISVGNRCKVQVNGQPIKLGTVMYVGTTDFKPGYWVGVKYDEPLGKNNGTVDGRQYFECENKYGAFVKPLSVTVGDFPEEDYGLDEM